MGEHINHIISKFRWDSTFDKKEKATEMQERLSSWSKTKMQKEIVNIFDAICPAEQTWKIQTLELDLGVIDWDNLESDLSLKIRQQLSDKLIELIINSNKRGENIEILNEDLSHISMLRNFLLSGVMPWNYKIADGSANKMLTYQLKNNKYQTMEMLREVGRVHENVRKRMAWQLEEWNVIKIIEGLESSSHPQIIDFSEELTNIQQQENIVQANRNDFKKNLWFWILNYLFTDRGTVFNKIAFMKSSIHQMSNHYNVEYHELLKMIEQAVAKVSVRSNVKADFMFVLGILSKEQEVTIQKTENEQLVKIDYWNVLATLFHSPEIRKTNDKKIEFNELVLSLAQENKNKFASLISNIGSVSKIWSAAIPDLNDASLETIVYAITPTQSETLIESVRLLNKISTEIHLKIERNVIWEIGIQFLLSHKHTPFNNKTFLDYTIAELSKRSSESKDVLLNKLTTTKIASASKTLTTLEIYTHLNSLLSEEVAEKKDGSSSVQFHELIEQLIKAINDNIPDKDKFAHLQKQLTKYIRLQPSSSLELLMNYPHKQELEKLLPFLCSNYHATLLVKKANTKTSNLLISIQRILTELKGDQKRVTLLSLINEHIFVIGLQTLLLHPEYAPARFLETVFSQLKNLITDSQQEAYNAVIEVILSHKKINTDVILSAELLKTKERLSNKKEQPLETKVLQLMQSNPSNKEAVAKLLWNKFATQECIQLRTNKTKEQELIINYLLPSGITFLNAIIKEYTALLANQWHGLSQTNRQSALTELIWKCILNYNQHYGKKEVLKTIINTAILLKYPESLRDETTNPIAPKTQKKPENEILTLRGNNITFQQLQQLIEECLDSPELKTNYHGATITWNDIIKWSITLQSSTLKSILDKISMSEKWMQKLLDNKQRAIIKNKNTQLKEQPFTANELQKLIQDCLKSNELTIIHKGTPLTLNQLMKYGLKMHSNELNAFLHRLLTKNKTASIISKTADQTPNEEGIQIAVQGAKITIDKLFLLIKECIKNEYQTIENETKEFSFQNLFKAGLEYHPSKLRALFSEISITEKRIRTLQHATDWRTFSLWIASDSKNEFNKTMETLRCMYDFIAHFINDSDSKGLQQSFWKYTWNCMTKTAHSETHLQDLLNHWLSKIVTNESSHSTHILSEIRIHNLWILPSIQNMLKNYNPAFAALDEKVVEKEVNQDLHNCYKLGLIEQLCSYLIVEKQIPAWYNNGQQLTVSELLQKLMTVYPTYFLKTLKNSAKIQIQKQHLPDLISFHQLTTTIIYLNKSKQQHFTFLGKLYQALGQLALNGISAKEIQNILYKKIMVAWLEENWTIISIEHIWQELIWDICFKRNIAKQEFINAVEKIKYSLPPSLQITFEYLSASAQQTPAVKTPTLSPILKKQLLEKKPTAPLTGGITVKNAGLVLLNNYIKILFERLGILKEQQFKDKRAQLDAVHYIQYVVTGLTKTEETLLPLNKLLCGLSLETPVMESISLSEEQKKLINSLIKAAIDHWPVIGNTSINGFRGNWLVRDGLLIEKEERWELTVEKRVYDLLIHKSPFSFSIIKYPWMNKPLHVTWPY